MNNLGYYLTSNFIISAYNLILQLQLAGHEGNAKECTQNFGGESS
jgi:hypothetical protein